MKRTALILFVSLSISQVRYNHPELDWKTFETDHFVIHYYDDTETSAREGADVAEKIYPYVTTLYGFKPLGKTHIVFTDTDDISNGAAYYYDNKIVIWTSPLEFELRGSHRWLQNVITHEFTHIVSIQKSMKFGRKFPGAYIQGMGYEKEKRKDVLYGYPNVMISYPIPGTTVPPWLAEGSAQYMYDGASWDNWDTTRDMILRDRVLNGRLLSWAEMNTFGKSGIGNESVYNAGYAFCRYMAVKYGPESLKIIMEALSSPINGFVNKAVKKGTGVDGPKLYKQFKSVLQKRYEILTKDIGENELRGKIIEENGTANLFPKWSPTGEKIAFLSNRNHDYFGNTDLFVHTLKSKKTQSITKGVYSKPSWHSDGNIIYYSKKNKWPDKQGSKYYDIYQYDLNTEKEKQLTKNARAFSPVFVFEDSSIIYISTKDGSQNIFHLNLKNMITYKLTDFQNHRIISGLTFDSNRNWIIFEGTDNHFRNIYYISLVDSSMGTVLGNLEWDERNPSVGVNSTMVYSDDRSGIFNLYLISPDQQGYITNVHGGAFMPDQSGDGKIVYSVYENGGYKIAILDSIIFADENIVGYSPTYFKRNRVLNDPITSQNTVKFYPHKDSFPPMFIMPKIMMDYKTLKPGFYFYSSEILDRVSLFGGASMNKHKDMDLFFIFEFRRLFPTLFFETYFQTRNTEEESSYTVYRLDNNLRFQLLQFRGGLRYPLYGSELEVYSSWNRYRASIKEKVIGQNIESGIGYDYFQGTEFGMKWELKNIKNRVDKNINPSGGYSLNADVRAENNNFIEGLNLSDAGTLVPEFSNYNYIRTTFRGSVHIELPKTRRWTVSTSAQFGWLSDAKIDSFFYFYGGGMPGLKGYPYYSFGGTNKLGLEGILRIPLFREKHIPLGWFILQNSALGFVYQMGDAWDRSVSKRNIKRSMGLQLRLNGFSFYNYPTAISFELFRGLDIFTVSIQEKNLTYGGENRLYFTLLFNF